MKKLLFSVFLLLISTTTIFGQELLPTDTTSMNMSDMLMKMFSNDLKINVDSTLFPVHQGSFYMSDTTQTPKALILTMLIPKSYDTVVSDFTRNSAKDKQMDIKSVTNLSINNKPATYINGTADEQGKKIIAEVYFIKEATGQTIMITGSFEIDTYEKYKEAFKKAVYSERINK
jgi:hypothetical protein